MKRFLPLLISVVCALAVFGAYASVDESEHVARAEAGSSLGPALLLPARQDLADPDVVFPAMAAAAGTAGVNLVRVESGFDASDRVTTTYFVLLNGQSRLEELVPVTSGRWLTPAQSQGSDAMLATSSMRAPTASGVIRDFSGNDAVAVRPLRALVESHAVAGRYFIESPTSQGVDRFRTALAASLSSHPEALGTVTTEGLQVSSGALARDLSATPARIAMIALVALLVATVILLAYQVLSQAKRAAVMRLHGHSAMSLWWAMAARTVSIVGALSIAGAWALTTLIPDAGRGFALLATTRVFGCCLLLLGVAWLPVLFLRGSRIGDGIKSRTHTLALFWASSAVRTAGGVAVILVIAAAVVQQQRVQAEEGRLGSWDQARAYGFFDPLSVGNDAEELRSPGAGPLMAAQVYDLYPFLNQRGALFVQATSFEQNDVPTPGTPGQDSADSMVVNPNYLKQYPVRDEHGVMVVVDEAEQDWVVLVPDSRRAEEAAIRARFEQQRRGGNGIDGVADIEPSALGRAAPAHIAHQQVRIIWLKSSQDVFAFNPNVAPDDAGLVRDPVIQVMTTGNSAGIDRANFMSSLKVRLNGDPETTLAGIHDELVKLRLDDNMRHIVTMDGYVAEQVALLRSQMRVIQAIALGAGLLLLAMLVQGLTVLFDRFARVVAVRRLHGYGLIRRNRQTITLLTIIWLLQWGLALLASRSLAGIGGPAASTATLAVLATIVAAAVTLIEFSAALAALSIIERRRLGTVLKGES